MENSKTTRAYKVAHGYHNDVYTGMEDKFLGTLEEGAEHTLEGGFWVGDSRAWVLESYAKLGGLLLTYEIDPRTSEDECCLERCTEYQVLSAKLIAWEDLDPEPDRWAGLL